MREWLAIKLVKIANKLSLQHKWRMVEKDPHNPFERLKRLSDELNGTLYQVPKHVGIWIDWTQSPVKLTITSDDVIVHPPFTAQKFAKVKTSLLPKR